jgi:hypothetical protein
MCGPHPGSNQNSAVRAGGSAWSYCRVDQWAAACFAMRQSRSGDVCAQHAQRYSVARGCPACIARLRPSGYGPKSPAEVSKRRFPASLRPYAAARKDGRSVREVGGLISV